MIVVLFDKTEIIVTKDEAEKIEGSLNRSESGRLKIKDHLVNKKSIAYIKPGGYTEVDRSPRVDPSRQLKSDNRSENEQYKAARKAASRVRDILKRRKVKTIHE